MNISSYDKAEVLAALYNGSRPQGLGFLHATSGNMTKEEAQQILDESEDKYFDYLKGRVLKIDLSGDELNTRLYNRDIGDGAAEAIISKLKPITVEK